MLRGGGDPYPNFAVVVVNHIHQMVRGANLNKSLIYSSSKLTGSENVFIEEAASSSIGSSFTFTGTSFTELNSTAYHKYDFSALQCNR